MRDKNPTFAGRHRCGFVPWGHFKPASRASPSHLFIRVWLLLATGLKEKQVYPRVNPAPNLSVQQSRSFLIPSSPRQNCEAPVELACRECLRNKSGWNDASTTCIYFCEVCVESSLLSRGWTHTFGRHVSYPNSISAYTQSQQSQTKAVHS